MHLRNRSKLPNHAILILTITALLLLWNNAPVYAQPLKIITIELKPWGFRDGKGNFTGIYYDYINRLAEAAGLTYTNTLVPYARVINNLEQGSADVSILMSNEKLDKSALKVGVVQVIENIAVGLKGTNFASMEKLRGKKVGVIKGAKYGDAFAADNTIQKVKVTRHAQSIKMLFAKRLDAIAGPKPAILFMVNQLGFDHKKLGEPLVLSSRNAYLHFSKKTVDAKRFSALKKAVEQFQNKKIFEKIFNNYMQ